MSVNSQGQRINGALMGCGRRRLGLDVIRDGPGPPRRASLYAAVFRHGARYHCTVCMECRRPWPGRDGGLDPRPTSACGWIPLGLC
ncbi:hypothetical protein SKAU_G00125460 [Synaphobranchus kaupii]|uniref:Uncharacterized protein n=1 Tax=Synaphobranchus kaupii TaxID=118154 RepID=A0A9Q1FPD0_SYNKA|nr:hypothetical protein SKAU_G00125460 [Synaphobranchus kaupii]